MPLNLANAELAGLHMQRMGRDCKEIQQVLLEEHFFFSFSPQFEFYDHKAYSQPSHISSSILPHTNLLSGIVLRVAKLRKVSLDSD